MKKLLLLTLCLSLAGRSFIRAQAPDASSKWAMEFFLLPAWIYNHAEVGLCFKGEKGWEQVLTLHATVNAPANPHNGDLSVHYNLNRYLRGGKMYVPAWFRIKNSLREVGYEEGYYPNTLRFSLGSGLGRLWRLCDNFFLRTEIGMGASLNLTNGNRIRLPNMQWALYSTDRYYPRYYPPVWPAIRLKLDFLVRFRNK